MALQGADLLLYPTAIGNEVGSQADNDTADMWRRAMDGHAVCNHVPVAAANRIGTEDELTFYGSSFVVDHRGRPLAEAGRDTTETIYAELDFAQATADRAGWGLFRDRRPDLYGGISATHIVNLRPVGWVFVLFGIFWGGWAVAAVNVERALHLTTGGFGLLLSLALVGAATSNAVGGTLCERFGTGRVLGTALLAWSVFLALGAVVRVPVVMELLIIVMVATAGLIDIAINVAATAALG